MTMMNTKESIQKYSDSKASDKCKAYIDNILN